LPPKVVQKAPVRGLFQYMLGAVSTAIRHGPFEYVFCAHLNYAPLAFVVARLLGIPMWLQLHGIEAWAKPSRLVRWSAEQSSIVTSVSRHTRRMFLRWADLHPHVIRVLPNTVGEQFRPDGDRDSAREKYGLSDKKVLLTVSRLSKQDRYKGHEDVVRCMPALCSEFDNLIYVIAGDGDLVGDLQEIAASLQIEDRVEFLGAVEHDALPSLYRAADVFVMPSTGEGFGIVYLEALACGTPVIAGNSDGAADPTQDGHLGIRTQREELQNSIAEALKVTGPGAESGEVNLARAESVSHAFGRAKFVSNVQAISRRIASVGSV
jgi:phosphatidylinositol alpha-1,6-mannosyltransferase